MNKFFHSLCFALCAFVLLFACATKSLASTMGVASLEMGAPAHDPLVVVGLAIAVIVAVVILTIVFHAKIVGFALKAKADVIADYDRLVAHLHTARAQAVSDVKDIKLSAEADISKAKSDADAIVAKAKADVEAAEAKVKAAV